MKGNVGFWMILIFAINPGLSCWVCGLFTAVDPVALANIFGILKIMKVPLVSWFKAAIDVYS